jgi:hypothetical protein
MPRCQIRAFGNRATELYIPMLQEGFDRGPRYRSDCRRTPPIRSERCHPACRLTARATTCPLAVSERERREGERKRMMGLEPTTFCMANASSGSRPFARSLKRLDCRTFPRIERTRPHPSERRTLPFLPRKRTHRASGTVSSSAGRSEAARTRSSARRIVGVSGSSSSESGFGGRARPRAHRS